MISAAKPCPYCGSSIDVTDPDTLHKSATVWVDGRFEGRSYHSFRFVDIADYDSAGYCYELTCRYGCGVTMLADSKIEVIDKWNTRCTK